MKRFDYVIPKDLKEAISILKAHGERARYIAGGTDILVRLKQGFIGLDCLVSLRRLPELKGISLEDRTLKIGGLTTFREIVGSELLQRELPVLVEASKVLANPQIRNVATLSGNLCNAAPSADSAPPLMVLETTLVLVGEGSERRVPIGDFFLGPGQTSKAHEEILKEVSIKLPSDGEQVHFMKIGRTSQDIAIVNGAICMALEKDEIKLVRIVLGAVAPTPLRLRKVEERLLGNKITKGLLDEAQALAEKEVSPISDVRASEEYRRHLSGVVTRRLIQKASGKMDL